jgi:tetratricopeptide (TPR) repeat protein
MRMCDEALAHRPNDVDTRLLLADLLIQEAEYGKAEAHLSQCLQQRPRDAQTLLNLGYVTLQLGNSPGALELAQRGLKIRSAWAPLLILKAMAHEYASEFSAALETAESIGGVAATGGDVATLKVAAFIGLGRYEEAIALARGIADDASRKPHDRRVMLLYLVKIFDRTGRYEEAMAACQQAHVIAPGKFDPLSYTRYVDDIIECFTPRNLRMMPRASATTELPVFVVGMPRSGTTLIEQIAASHPSVYGAGEIRDIVNISRVITAETGSVHTYPRAVIDLDSTTVDRLGSRYLKHLQEIGGQAARVVNKALEQYEHLGLISMLFPGSRIIHCRRDPRDVCLSCYTRHLSQLRLPYATSLAHLGQVYREHERLMTHWKATLDMPILTLQYEDLVADQVTVTRKMIDFLGLPWNDRCLRYWESKRKAVTLSYDQVNRPIYDSSIGRWRHYERHLQPLFAALAGD